MRRAASLAVAVVLAATGVAWGAGPGRPLLVTVDDLPVGAGGLHADAAERMQITNGLLAALARHRVPAVGFVIWGNVRTDADREILAAWLNAGHELGNHSATHPDLSRTATDTWIADVERGREGLAAFLASRQRLVRFFRFPYLREGDTEAKLTAVRAYLRESGQRAVPVTIDDQDWSFEQAWVTAERTGDHEAMARIGDDFQRALRTEVQVQTELGDELFGRPVPQVLLLHANAVGAAQWDALFTWLESRGYRFAAADEVMGDEAIAAQPPYFNGPGGSLWHRVRAVRQREAAETAVRTLLNDQADAWSRGDITAFCSVYADDAVFLTPTGLTRGRAEVEARYRGKYPDAAAMGRLTLEPIEIRQAWGNEATELGDAVPSRTHGVSVVARWTLARSDGSSATGLTLLVLHRRDGRWVIVEDASM